jgi:hypothetical protein
VSKSSRIGSSSLTARGNPFSARAARFARRGNRTLEAADRETAKYAVRSLVEEARIPDRTTGTAVGRTGSKANQRNSCSGKITANDYRDGAACAARITRALATRSAKVSSEARSLSCGSPKPEPRPKTGRLLGRAVLNRIIASIQYERLWTARTRVHVERAYI